MRAIALSFLLSFSIYGARPELHFSFDYGLRHYELTTENDVLKLKTPGVRLSVEKKACNEKVYNSFIQRYSLMLGKYPHRRIGKPPEKKANKKDFNKVLYRIGKESKATYMAMPQSELGQHFLKLPENFALFKRQALLYCQETKKTNHKSKK